MVRNTIRKTTFSFTPSLQRVLFSFIHQDPQEGVPPRGGDVTASDDVTALDSIKIQSRLSDKVPARERPGQRNAKVGTNTSSISSFFLIVRTVITFTAVITRLCAVCCCCEQIATFGKELIHCTRPKHNSAPHNATVRTRHVED